MFFVLALHGFWFSVYTEAFLIIDIKHIFYYIYGPNYLVGGPLQDNLQNLLEKSTTPANIILNKINK